MEFYSVNKIKNSISLTYLSANLLLNHDSILLFSKGDQISIHLDEIYHLEHCKEDKLKYLISCTGKKFYIKFKSKEEKQLFYYYINLYKYRYNTSINNYKQITEDSKKYQVKEYKTNLQLFLNKEIYYEMINNLNKNLLDYNDIREIICYKLVNLFKEINNDSINSNLLNSSNNNSNINKYEEMSKNIASGIKV